MLQCVGRVEESGVFSLKFEHFCCIEVLLIKTLTSQSHIAFLWSECKIM